MMEKRAGINKMQEEEEAWRINQPPFYENDLRAQMQIKPKSNDIIDVREARIKLHQMQTQWCDMVDLQDDWEKLRRKVEGAHIDMHQKLNPIFYMQDLRS